MGERWVGRARCPKCGDERLSVDLVAVESWEVVGWHDGRPVLGKEMFDRELTSEITGSLPYVCFRGHAFRQPNTPTDSASNEPTDTQEAGHE